MKLKSFRIWNYKSIIDSGECRLSDNDNVLVLAGQNESGKSAVLQALYDYESAELREDCERRLDGDSFEYPIIKCTYIIEESDDLINEVDAKNQALTDRIVEAIKPLKEITIIRKFKSQDEFILSFDNEFGVLLRNVVGETQAKTERVIENDTEAETEKETDSNQIDMERLENDIADQIFQVTPKIIFFDDFCDLLPDKILISDLVNKNKDAKGYSAVKNVEKILGTNFADYQKLSDAVRASRQDVHTRRLTADFNQRWTQKIFEDNQVTIDVDYNQGGAEGQAYLNFFILTKEGEYLTPQQRSKGLIWFLSFYLQLTAESKATEELIILFDEPGLYLHSKAQADIKSLFEELAQKDQIIYSTHSPYLIDTNKLNRLRLVINSKEAGTTVDKITTKKVRDQKDARKPIIDAIGLEVAHDFSCADKKNVILEGLSDYYYFTGMKKILSVENDYSFLPSMGASNVHLLMELCLGWGLDWLIILDGGRQANNEFKKIKNAFFEGDETKAKSKIHRIADVEGIEDLLMLSDLRLVVPTVQNPDKYKNSKLVSDYGGKELFGRIFSEKVNTGEINNENISKTAMRKFMTVFDFIEASLGR